MGFRSASSSYTSGMPLGIFKPTISASRNAVEVLDQRADRIAVRRDHHAFAGADGRRHGLVPERQDARHRVLQAFRERHFLGLETGVAQVGALAARVVRIQHGGRCVIAATPDQYLLVAVLPGGLSLVQTLQGPVVALVEAPVVDDRQPLAVQFIQGVPQGVDGALEHAGVAEVELIAFCFQQPACVLGLLHAGGGQVDIGPAGEAVVEVPGGFAVADENEFVHGDRVF